MVLTEYIPVAKTTKEFGNGPVSNSPAIPLPTAFYRCKIPLPAGSAKAEHVTDRERLFGTDRVLFEGSKAFFPCRQGNAQRMLPGRLLDVPAKLVAHGRQHLAGKIGLAARAEALKECGRQDVCGDRLVDRRLDGPASLARIRNAPRKTGKRRVFGECARGQIQEPGGDDAAAPPQFRDVGQVQIVLIVLRVTQRCRLRV